MFAIVKHYSKMNVKKKYISPKLEAVGVDRDILLVSMSRGIPGSPSEGRDDSGNPNGPSDRPFPRSTAFPQGPEYN